MTTILEMNGIRKVFPGVIANDNVDFSVEQGEIHALVGENGAGKTTLMNILYGQYRADSGTLRIKGQFINLHGSHNPMRLGLGMVHQHFKLIPSFTVAHNIALGIEPRHSKIFLDKKELYEGVRKISEQFGLRIDPKSRVRDLPVGVQQRVEILKALYRNADILILDEPTAVLTPQETDELFDVIRSLVEGGKTVIFITHKLREVIKISDRVTVMRDGKVIGRRDTKDTNTSELARMIVGREVLLNITKDEARPGDVVLRLKNLCAVDDRGTQALRDISFELRRGEILGVAGVEGNGQTELIQTVVGMRPVKSGAIYLSNHDITHRTIRERRELGLACVPEDRYESGVGLGATIEDNLIVNSYHKSPFSKYGILDPKRISSFASKSISDFDIRTSGKNGMASTLSGGNLQKVVLARELGSEPKLLAVAQPTRGLDIGSIEFVHRQIIDARDKGTAVLLVSAELEEVMSLSDRIVVLYEGKIVGECDAATATEEGLGLWMAGIVEEPIISEEYSHR